MTPLTRALWMLPLLIGVAACSDSPTAPTSVAAPLPIVTGEWTGSQTIACDLWTCGFIGATPPPQPMRLTFTGPPTDLSGTWTLDGPWYRIQFPVSGAQQPDGSVRVAGESHWNMWCLGVGFGSPIPAQMRITDWVSTIDPSGQMLARMTYVVTHGTGGSCSYHDMLVTASAVLTRAANTAVAP